jgi:two-component system nitrogen regulation sensor histidine kinase NtrY
MPLTRNPESRRKRTLLIASCLLALMVAASIFQVALRAPQIPIASNLLVLALLNLNAVVFLVLLVILVRNLVKLSFERRHKVIGSRFKAKLVLTFLFLAVAPAILIFIVASNFITTSIEGWFKPQVERPLDQALEVAQAYYQNLEATAVRHGRYIARVAERDGLLAEGNRSALLQLLEEQRDRLGLAAISVIPRGGADETRVTDPVAPAALTSEPPASRVAQGLAGQEITTVTERDDGDLIQAVVPIRSGGREPLGVVVVSTHVSQRLEARLRGISQAFQDYKQLKLLKTPIKGIYVLLFMLMTLIIVVATTWFGLYLARGITDPIQVLAQGTREVSAGNLNYKVLVRADDEIGTLVDSFNQMTSDLASSKAKLEEAYLDLQAKHEEMERRRRYTETVLEAVATGVVSIDAEGRITTVNSAAERMLGVGAAVQGQPAAAVFRHPDFADIAALIGRMARRREPTVEREIHLRRDGHAVTMLASATALRGPDGADMGLVIVLDDLTELLKAQRLAAWREVAQRIAHEIKNPLTPIQLSAQRLRRRLAGDRHPEEKRLLEEATATIIEEVDGLKQLVDEFSRFARMPAPALRTTDLGRLVEAVLVLYRESYPALTLTASLAPDVPPIEVDPNQIRRAVTNLVENAVEAAGPAGEVGVELVWLPASRRARIVVEDAGPGIPPDVRERLFTPYFSTKATGMGLGLPIVHQIVADHGGAIWLEDRAPHGSRFVIELPVGVVAPAPAQV